MKRALSLLALLLASASAIFYLRTLVPWSEFRPPLFDVSISIEKVYPKKLLNDFNPQLVGAWVASSSAVSVHAASLIPLSDILHP